MDSKKSVQCVDHKQHFYHLRNTNKHSSCLALEQKNGKALRVVRFNCNDNSLEMQWIKLESSNKNYQGAFHICQSLNAKTQCLSVSKKSNGNFILTLNLYINAGQRNSNYQIWRLHPITNQLVNIETRLCLKLTGVDVCNEKRK